MNKQLTTREKVKNINTKDKIAIIKTDGGICSQIAFAALGKYLEDQGFCVKYDLSWFKDYGKDCNNQFVRNYDMDNTFPLLKLKIATDEEIKYFKKKNICNNSLPVNNQSAYICGYSARREISFIEYKNYFKNYFNPIDKDNIEDIEEQILAVNSCGVHVRRGDLSVYNSAYGYPTPVSYYLKSIKIIHGLSSKVKFFFFSEECDWIKKEIIPKVDFDIDYEICDRNGADKGYLDLYLMSKCDYLISSSGSLAKFAKVFSNKNPMLIMDRFSQLFTENLDNILILNDTMLINAKNKQEKMTYSNIQKDKTSILKNLFCIKNSDDKTHKIITVLGIKIKIKRRIKL